MEISDNDNISTGIKNLIKKHLISKDACTSKLVLENEINYYLIQIIDDGCEKMDIEYAERIGVWRNTPKHVEYLKKCINYTVKNNLLYTIQEPYFSQREINMVLILFLSFYISDIAGLLMLGSSFKNIFQYKICCDTQSCQ